MYTVFKPLAFALCFTALTATAQPSAPTQATPPAASPMPKVPSSTATSTTAPTEQRTAPADARADKPVAPLMTVPLGRQGGAPEGPAASRQGPTSGPVDDTMARCTALRAGAERNDCLRKARITSPKP